MLMSPLGLTPILVNIKNSKNNKEIQTQIPNTNNIGIWVCLRIFLLSFGPKTKPKPKAQIFVGFHCLRTQYITIVMS